MTNLDDGSSRAGEAVPTQGAVVQDRFSSDEIFQRLIAAADEELTAGRRELFFSGVAAGLAITITFLLYASLTAATDGDPIASVLLYPLGFVYIIIGGYQLFTENTLPPVALVLERLASLPALLSHWTAVLAGNFAGGALGAIVLAWTGVFSPDAAVAAEGIAQSGLDESVANLFFKGAIAGLIVAGVVWVEYAARDTISRVVVIYVAFLAIPLGNLFHVVISFTEMWYLLMLGEVGLFVGTAEFVVPVLLGNTIGGVVLVTVVNYYQTSDHRLGSLGAGITRLNHREWLLGSRAGRGYVPVIDHHQPPTAPTESESRALVAVEQPEQGRLLARLGAAMTHGRPGALVHLAHVVNPTTPTERTRQVTLSKQQLEPLVKTVERFETHCESCTVASGGSLTALFGQARQEVADVLVVDRSPAAWSDLVARGRKRSPCDILAVNSPGVTDGDLERVLVLVDGETAVSGDDSKSSTENQGDEAVSARLARGLSETDGATVTVVGRTEKGLTRWRRTHDFDSVRTAVVDESFDSTLRRRVDEQTLVVMGASAFETGLVDPALLAAHAAVLTLRPASVSGESDR